MPVMVILVFGWAFTYIVGSLIAAVIVDAFTGSSLLPY
jgi:hypothetical protein